MAEYKLQLIIRQPSHEGSIAQLMGIYQDESYATSDVQDRNRSDPSTSGQYVKFAILKEEAIPDYHRLSLAADSTNASQVSVSGIATLEAAKHEPSGEARHSYAEWNIVSPINASGIQLVLHGMIPNAASGFTRAKAEITDYQLFCHIKDAVRVEKTWDSEIPGISQPHTVYPMSTTIACNFTKDDPFTLRITRLDDEDSMPESIYFISASYRFLPV